ncbi:MAG: hypothetical protein NC350_00215 [Corallococcus sp.]|nr:hypothetical protein [Corallococcus sp.]
MNDLTITLNSITSEQDKSRIAKTIYLICRTITPQFYKKQTSEEMRAEIISIYLLIKNIRQDALAKMCELAVENYAIARARNRNAYFDVNYILTFYDEAWDTIRPPEFNIVAEITDKYVAYGRIEDYEDFRLKENAPIWYDERQRR